MKAWNDILNPKFIGSWDIPTDGTVIAKITDAKKESVDNFKTNKKEEKLIIYLEKFKPLVCNITNAKAISLALGTKFLEEWIGKYIEIGTKKIRAFGETTLALRVKDTAPQPPQKPFLTPTHKFWDMTVKAVADGKTTIEDIKLKSQLTESDQERLIDEGIKYLESKSNE